MKATRRPASRLPFQGLSRHNWINLVLAVLLVFYSAQVVLDMAWGNLFGNLGVDFASFWSAGHIANHYGYGAVYDLKRMAQIQQQLLPDRVADASDLYIVPTPYLPVFLVPFQLLALLPPSLAAGVWIALNLVGSAMYLRGFAARITGRRLESRLLLMLMISAPVFLNLFLGQANLWLMICVGEFILASMSGRVFQSGLWLAGLLLKPQTLILVVPAVLMQRRTKTTLGMLVAGLLIIGGSWLLAGTDAIIRLSQLWLGYAGGLPTNDPQLMMNWRMIGLHFEGLVGSDLASIVVIVGMAGTAAGGLALWIRPLAVDHSQFVVASLGLFAATAVVAWHSHVHMAMLLIPPLLILALQHGDPLRKIFEWWILFPAALYVIRIILASIIHIVGLGGGAYTLLDFLAGIGLFGMNLVLLGWTLRRLKPWQPAPPSAPAQLDPG
ncbi:MAG: glycosyltransferase family 87 protein [Chloroflexota bacterium]